MHYKNAEKFEEKKASIHLVHFSNSRCLKKWQKLHKNV